MHILDEIPCQGYIGCNRCRKRAQEILILFCLNIVAIISKKIIKVIHKEKNH